MVTGAGLRETPERSKAYGECHSLVGEVTVSSKTSTSTLDRSCGSMSRRRARERINFWYR